MRAHAARSIPFGRPCRTYASVPHAQFAPSKKQRRTLNNLYFALSGTTKPAKYKGKWASNHKWDLEERLALVLDQAGDVPPYRGAPYTAPVPERITVRMCS